jgi:hypothetical protein
MKSESLTSSFSSKVKFQIGWISREYFLALYSHLFYVGPNPKNIKVA